MGKPRTKKDTSLVNNKGQYTELGKQFLQEMRTVCSPAFDKMILLAPPQEINFLIDALKHEVIFKRLMHECQLPDKAKNRMI